MTVYSCFQINRLTYIIARTTSTNQHINNIKRIAARVRNNWQWEIIQNEKRVRKRKTTDYTSRLIAFSIMVSISRIWFEIMNKNRRKTRLHRMN